MTGKRHCKGTTKKGKPCGANPLKAGTEIEGVKVSGDWCRTHDPDLPTSAQFGTAEQADANRTGRKPKPTIPGLMRQAVEDHVLVVLAPHFKTLGYQPVIEGERIALERIEGGGAKLFGESRDGIIKVSDNEDLGAQMKAADQLIDRVYGRPKQTTELAGEIQGGGDTIFVVPDDDNWHQQVLAKVTEAEAAKVGSTNGGDPTSNGDGDH